MKVLVTGGTGVIGEGVIPALLKAGHEVRLLTRGADKDAEEWPEGVEPFAADVSRKKSLRGAAAGCQVVIHITGIISESPPKVTFEGVNVEGTRNILTEAQRARVERFIFVSSLGADRGRSLYHQSKLRAEELVKEFPGEWLILRPGGVYGPGDEVISTLLKLIRTLPVMPTIDGGDQRFQPIWFEDMGEAVARAVEMDGLAGKTLEVAGDEITTMDDIIDRLARITGRSPLKVSVPSTIASLGAQLFEGSSIGDGIKRITGLDVPVEEAKLQMLLEENFIKKPKGNALVKTLGIKPLPLDEGLKALADLLPEQTVTDGVGELERKRFYADIEQSRLSASRLLAEFRERCVEIMPLEFQAEPGAAGVVEEGATLTASLPLRGNIQVRVEEVTSRRITFVTLEGHPLAGVVQFKTSALKPKGVRFMIEIHTRHASLIDRLAMSVGGSVMQNMNWREVVERVVDLSGGSAPGGVESEEVTLDEAEARKAERVVEGIVKSYKRTVKAESNPRIKDERKASSSSARGSKRKTRLSPQPKTMARGGKAQAKSPAGRSAGGGGASQKSSKKRGAAQAQSGGKDLVGAVSEAASSLVKSLSSAAASLRGGGKKKRARKSRR